MSLAPADSLSNVHSATYGSSSQSTVNQGVDPSSWIGSSVLSSPREEVTPMREREVEPGSPNLEARRVDAVINAANPEEVTTVLTAENPAKSEAPASALIAVRVPQPDKVFDEAHFDKYLNSDKAQMVFSTAAMHGQGSSRAVDLKKKGDGEEVNDTERQQKVNLQFAKIKHGIGVSGRDGLPNKTISYSLTWHFVEVYDRPGEPPKRYDLVDKKDIERLLSDQDVDDVSQEKVNRLYKELLAINKELKGLTENEVGKKKDAFLHDYIGNPNGLGLFSPSSNQDMQVKSNEPYGKYTRNLRDFGLIEKRGFLSSDRLTSSGVKAFNHIKESKCLQDVVLYRLDTRIEEIKVKLKDLRGEEESEANTQEIQNLEVQRQELMRVRSEIFGASKTAMDFTTMELSRTHTDTHKEKKWNAVAGRFIPGNFSESGQRFLEPLQEGERLSALGPVNEGNDQAALKVINERRFALAKQASIDYARMVSRENHSGLPLTGVDYVPTKQDKQKAIEIGSLVYHLTGDETRLDMIEAQQRLGRQAFEDRIGSEVFREPNAEKFLLGGTFNIERDDNITKEHLAGYRGEPKHVQDELLGALNDFQCLRATLTLRNEGESL